MNKYKQDFCWRGVSKKSFIDDYGLLTFEALVFDKIEKTNRQDNFLELSVNWDAPNSLECLFQQETEGRIQFCAAGKIDMQHLKMCLKVLIEAKKFAMEESPTESNEFHGNLLYNQTLDKQTVKTIKNTIVFSCGTNIEYNENFSDSEEIQE